MAAGNKKNKSIWLPDKWTPIGVVVTIVVGAVSIYSVFRPQDASARTKKHAAAVIKHAAPVNSRPSQITSGPNSQNFGGGNSGQIYNGPVDQSTHISPTSDDPPQLKNAKVGVMTIVGDWRAVLRPQLKAGDKVRISATGEVVWGYLAGQTAGPEGSNLGFYPKAPLPIDDESRIAALIGKFGNGKPFIIGEQKTLTVQRGGLALGLNDGNTGNNRKGFTVTIQKLN